MSALGFLFRHDLQNRKRSVSISFLIVMIVAALLQVSISTALQSFTLYDKIHQELNGPDIWMWLKPKGIEAVRAGDLQIPEAAERTEPYRFVKGQYLNGQLDVGLLLTEFPSKMPEMGKLKILQGHSITADDDYGVVLDKSFADNARLMVGDRFQVKTMQQLVTFHIVGLSEDSTHLPYPHQLTVSVYLNDQTFKKIGGLDQPDGAFIGYKLHQPENAGKVLNQVLDKVKNLDWVEEGSDRFTMADYFFNNDILMVVLLLSFDILAILAAWMIIGNLVGTAVLRETSVTGILKTLGFTPRQILLSYVLQNIYVSFVSASVGLFVGSLLAPLAAIPDAKLYGMANDLQIQPFACIAVLLLILSVVFLSSYFPALRASRMTAVRAVSFGAEIPNSKGNSILFTLAKMLIPLSIGTGIKDFWIRPIRTTVSFLVILFAIVALTFSFILNDTMNQVQKDPGAYGYGIARDLYIRLNGTPASEVEKQFVHVPEIKDDYFVTNGLLVSQMDSGIRFYLTSFGGSLKKFPLQIQEGRAIQGIDELVVGEGLLKRTGLRLGDTLQTEINGKNAELKIVGRFFTTDNLGMYGVVSFDTLQKYAAVQPDWIGLKLSDRSLSGKVANQLAQLVDNHVDVHTDQLLIPEEVVLSIHVLFWLCVCLSVIAMIGLFNSLLVSVLDRQREYGILKSVGMTGQQIFGGVLANGLSLGFLACLIGIPLGILITKGLLVLISQILQSGQISFYIPWGKLLLLFPVSFLVVILSASWPAHRASQLSPIQLLRDE